MWRNMVPQLYLESFSFHFIKTFAPKGGEKEREKRRARLIKKTLPRLSRNNYCCIYLKKKKKKTRRKRDKMYNVITSNLCPTIRRIDLDYVTNG